MAREERDMNGRSGSNRLALFVILILLLIGLLAGAVLLWTFRDDLRSPQALYREVQRASADDP